VALKITATNNTNGQQETQAYARITNFFGTKDQVQVQVEIHATEEARKAGWPSIQQQAHYIGMESLQGDLIPAMYEVLKTFTQYQGAEDC
tara:strand:+ start:104 stop:373 length:270 start_codon:yes stop_codon:yes gene_type:complete